MTQDPRDSAWAKPVGKLTVNEIPSGAINLNVAGRRLAGPIKGFGQLWQKTYRVRLRTERSPAELVQEWKAKFPEFWPEGNRFYGSLTGIAPGDVAVLNLAAPGGMPLSTGVMVIYADTESFSFMTPQGHMFAGMITFSANQEEEGLMAVQIQALIRASDPIYETTFRLGFGHKAEDKFWEDTLTNLANYFGQKVSYEQLAVCVDKKVQWSEAKNVWHNAAIRTVFYAPVHFTKRLFKRGEG